MARSGISCSAVRVLEAAVSEPDPAVFYLARSGISCSAVRVAVAAVSEPDLAVFYMARSGISCSAVRVLHSYFRLPLKPVLKDHTTIRERL